jgi:hypothetical protein
MTACSASVRGPSVYAHVDPNLPCQRLAHNLTTGANRRGRAVEVAGFARVTNLTLHIEPSNRAAVEQATIKRRDMKTYAIRRLNAWGSPEELERVAERSKEVADSEFPDDIRWIRSYVIAEEEGTLGTVCIYQASDMEAVRKHAHRVGMPADEIWEVADTVIIRPDPTKEAAAP